MGRCGSRAGHQCIAASHPTMRTRSPVNVESWIHRRLAWHVEVTLGSIDLAALANIQQEYGGGATRTSCCCDESLA